MTSRVEHSNSRFESILFDSLCESIRFVKKSAFRFISCHAAFHANLVYSLSQKISCHCLRRLILYNIDKKSYAMHTIKITPNLIFEYQCTSGKFIRLLNRIESNRNFFCPNWNALVSRRAAYG